MNFGLIGSKQHPPGVSMVDRFREHIDQGRAARDAAFDLIVLTTWVARTRRAISSLLSNRSSATETVPHDKVMSSIEMLGRHVIPALKKQKRRVLRSAR